MDRRDWLLLSIGERMEPIQLQKTLFKFAMESGAAVDELYRFEPYSWGPCSFDIYDDLGELRAEGLIEAVPSGRGWNMYHLTDDGKARGKEIRTKAKSLLLEKLGAARNYVTSRDFRTLLRDIYKEYPKFATQTLFSCEYI